MVKATAKILKQKGLNCLTRCGSCNHTQWVNYFALRAGDVACAECGVPFIVEPTEPTPEKKYTCSNCGRATSNSDRLCGECASFCYGAHCPKCGWVQVRQTEDGKLVCRYCGTHITP